jgi:MraZ protein
MDPSETTQPTYYQSTYRHGVDVKRRVQIPAKWRPSDASVTFTLMLWRRDAQQNPCVLVLPPERMQALAEKISSMPFGDPKAEALRRLLGKDSDQVSVDKSGRVCLPEQMARSAGIEDEAVLVGMIDRFQIWRPDHYESASVVDNALLSEAMQLI